MEQSCSKAFGGSLWGDNHLCGGSWVSHGPDIQLQVLVVEIVEANFRGDGFLRILHFEVAMNPVSMVDMEHLVGHSLKDA
jgi:hypothetical protein